jgi:hypothetical protein
LHICVHNNPQFMHHCDSLLQPTARRFC